MVSIFDFLDARACLYKTLSSDIVFRESIMHASSMIEGALTRGNKLLIFGNGGSAAEAQHFAAELICRFETERKSIPAIALTTDSSILTAEGNDAGFEYIFSRQIEGLTKSGDIVFGITTSDFNTENRHSVNIREAFLIARRSGAVCIGLFSAKTKDLLQLVDAAVIVPDQKTALIQEVHLCIIHLLCSLIEEKYKSPY